MWVAEAVTWSSTFSGACQRFGEERESVCVMKGVYWQWTERDLVSDFAISSIVVLLI